VSLQAFLSKSQIQKLASIGLNDLYSILTYLPYSIEEVQSLESSFGFGQDSNETQKLSWQAELTKIEKKQGANKSYYLLEFQKDNRRINCFYFTNASFLTQLLQLNQIYDLKISQKKNYFTIEKLKLLKPEELVDTKEQIKTNQTKIQVKYSQSGILKSPFFEQIHRQIPDQAYLLNLNGLLPESNLIPQIIDLKKMHKPLTQTEFWETKKQWIALQVFLKIATMRYLSLSEKQKMARGSHLDLEFLKSITNNLPFELSPTQKSTIWDILQEVKIN
jgi:RecG-like helicase